MDRSDRAGFRASRTRHNATSARENPPPCGWLRGLSVCRCSTETASRGGDVYALGVAPKTLEIVIGAGARREDVNQEVAIIHQDPLRVFVAFDADREVAVLLQLEADLIGDSLDLAQ